MDMGHSRQMINCFRCNLLNQFFQFQFVLDVLAINSDSRIFLQMLYFIGWVDNACYLYSTITEQEIRHMAANESSNTSDKNCFHILRKRNLSRKAGCGI